MRMGIHLSLGDVAADEFYAMLAIEEADDRYDNEHNGHRST